MQPLKSVQNFQHFFPPISISISNYGQNQHKKRPRLHTITSIDPSLASDTNSAPKTPKSSSISSTTTTSTTKTDNTTSSKRSQQRWSREQLSLLHEKNRSLYRKLNIVDIDYILNKLVHYGFETSEDIAKMPAWQLRVLRKEIPSIANIYLQAYNIWGKEEYYDDEINKNVRQFNNLAMWLEWNEISLILKNFDHSNRTFRCFICGTNKDLDRMDLLRWHLWISHRDSPQLKAALEESRDYHIMERKQQFQRICMPDTIPFQLSPTKNDPNEKEYFTNSKNELTPVIDISNDDNDLNPNINLNNTNMDMNMHTSNNLNMGMNMNMNMDMDMDLDVDLNMNTGVEDIRLNDVKSFYPHSPPLGHMKNINNNVNNIINNTINNINSNINNHHNIIGNSTINHNNINHNHNHNITHNHSHNLNNNNNNNSNGNNNSYMDANDNYSSYLLMQPLDEPSFITDNLGILNLDNSILSDGPVSNFPSNLQFEMTPPSSPPILSLRAVQQFSQQNL